MNIVYPVTKYYTKEVHSKDYDEKLKLLEEFMEFGLIVEIKKYHNDTEWELHGIVSRYSGNIGYLFTGNWDEDMGEAQEVTMEIDWPETVKSYNSEIDWQYHPPKQPEYVDFPGDLL